MSESSLPETMVSTGTREKRGQKTRKIPPYNVILENDDHHSFAFVVDVLCKALGMNEQRAIQYTTEAHTKGRAIVWTGSKEVAELKMEQMQSFHEIRDDGRKLGPLGVTIEPAT